jgi:hypothetical protein
VRKRLFIDSVSEHVELDGKSNWDYRAMNMLIDVFIKNGWACIGLWVLLTISDYYLTIKGAKMYQQGVKKHFIFSHGYELEPDHQKEIANLQPVSFNLVLQLFLFSGLLAISYYTMSLNFFTFFWGSLVLLQFAVHSRHFRNIILFYFAKKSEGIRGQIEYDHKLSLRLSSYDFLYFALLFLFTYLMSGSIFLLGGAASCLLTTARQIMLSRKDISAIES